MASRCAWIASRRARISPTEVVRLAVAVGAEDREVLQAVVVMHAIAVVQCQRDRPTPPVAQPTFLASVFFESCLDESPFQVLAVKPAMRDQPGLDRCDVSPRPYFPRLHGLRPGAA